MDKMLCDGPECGVQFAPSGDDWYRIERMHDDRIGLGPLEFHDRICALRWLQRQQDISIRPIGRRGANYAARA